MIEPKARHFTVLSGPVGRHKTLSSRRDPTRPAAARPPAGYRNHERGTCVNRRDCHMVPGSGHVVRNPLLDSVDLSHVGNHELLIRNLPLQRWRRPGNRVATAADGQEFQNIAAGAMAHHAGHAGASYGHNRLFTTPAACTGAAPDEHREKNVEQWVGP